MNLSVVVPVFNDTASLPELTRRIFSMATQQHHDVELVMVDDGSKNDAWEALKAVKDVHRERKVILLRLSRNLGQNAATLYGLSQCHADVCVTLDADLQHRPEDIPLLVDHLFKGNLDIVYGAASAGHPPLRRLASRLFRLMTDQIGRPPIISSAFRAIRGNIIKRLLEQRDSPTRPIDISLREISLKIETVETPHYLRAAGSSTYSWLRLLKVALSIMMTSRFYNFAALLMIAAGATSLILLDTSPSPHDERHHLLSGASGGMLAIGLMAVLQKGVSALEARFGKTSAPIIQERIE